MRQSTLLVLVVVSLWSAEAAVTPVGDKRRVFLLAGDTFLGGEIDDVLTDAVLIASESSEAIDDDTKSREIASLLNQILPDDMDADQLTPQEQLSNYEAQYIIDLNNQGMINFILSESESNIDCRPFHALPEGRFFSETESSPLSLSTQFDPAMMIGHTLYDSVESPYQFQPLSIFKLQAEETTFAQLEGHCWEMLRSTILNLDPATHRYEAFVWYAGENSCLESQASDNYLENLKTFVQDVRRTMALQNGDPDDSPPIPVVIVHIEASSDGYENGPNGMEAHQTFVEEDPAAVVVLAFDLTRFFHHEAVAQMILGRRIADAIITLTAGDTINEDAELNEPATESESESPPVAPAPVASHDEHTESEIEIERVGPRTFLRGKGVTDSQSNFWD